MFVVKFHHERKNWSRRSVKMKKLQVFALDREKNDLMMSWDFKSGYRQFCRHPDVRDLLILRNRDVLYRCIALPFGRGR